MVIARILPFGDAAVLAEFSDGAGVSDFIAAVGPLPVGVTDIVPAARTVLATFDPYRTSAAAVRSWLEHVRTDARERPVGQTVTLDVRYDGADLGSVADVCGVSPDELVAVHSGVVWTVAFTGFAPGFGYLESKDWPFRVPRLSSPRTRVPVGAVGLADGYCGAYPRETPGGWQLIGTTDAALFVVDREPPALLAPGTRVRFRQVGA